MEHHQRFAILVGGGPAPGINSVIAAATIRARLEGYDVVGVRDGFEWLMQGDIDHVTPLTIEAVSRIHFRGGSHLGIARANPTTSTTLLDQTVNSLLRLNVTQLITIGGDDTAFSAMRLERHAAGAIRVVHVPKTIDNDLDLPAHIDTFGYQTARHYGVEIVKNLMVDAKTTSRWYFVVAMGRKTGHLALGIGKAAAAALVVIPEEFRARPVRLSRIVDTLVGAIVKRSRTGRPDGVAVLAEGLIEVLDPNDLKGLESVGRDEHGHLRLAEVDIGDILKREVERQLTSVGSATSIVAKNIGYELRCADPIPYDIDYTRDLGYCAAELLLNGGNAAMISIQNGRFVPIPFKDILDRATGRMRVRMVDVESESYQIARRYMIRLSQEDFTDADEIGRYAQLIGLTSDAFRKRFSYLVQ
jgi:6-phosphofructokinase 1